MSELFESASKMKLRFQTSRGLVTTEDLWDMPLVDSRTNFSLDALAKWINRQVKEAEEESFVEPHSTKNTTLVLALDIVKRVIEVKLKNIEAQNKRTTTAARKDKILEILASKEDEGLRAKSAEELMEMLKED